MASDPSISQFRSAAGKVASGAGIGEKSVAGAAGGAKAKVDSAGDAVGDLYADSEARARGALDEVPASLSDIAAAGERLVSRGRQTLDHGVRNQPVEALLLAGAIGYLAGWAAKRG